MEDGGKRVVEVMQKPLPVLVLRRLAEAHLVVGERVPAHQQEVMPFALEAALQLMRAIARHRGDDGLRLAKGRLERLRFSGLDLQLCGFEDHRMGRGAWKTPKIHGRRCRRRVTRFSEALELRPTASTARVPTRRA